MARKNKNTEITPLMGLSMLAIFIMMPVIFFMSNNKKEVKQSYAARPTPSPTARPMRY